MMTSVVIAYRNDWIIKHTVDALLKGQDSTGFEVIIVDDFSDAPLEVNPTFYPNVRVVRNNVQRGVGYSFDKGVSEATGENIVLLGSDVIVKNPDWLDIAEDYCANYRKSLGCSVCLSLNPSQLNPNFPADEVRRYGATILPLSVTKDDTLTEVGAFDAKWIKVAPKEDISEVPCIYGAWYVTTKSWYQHIGGWNSDFTRKLSGHKNWGSLEPWISIKSYLYGGSCHVLKNLESGHCFHKFGDDGSPHGRTDYYWYNKLFIAYTNMPTNEAKCMFDKIYNLRIKYELYTLPMNLGKKLLKSNWDYVTKIRERNKAGFVHDFDWFCDRFNIKKTW